MRRQAESHRQPWRRTNTPCNLIKAQKHRHNQDHLGERLCRLPEEDGNHADICVGGDQAFLVAEKSAEIAVREGVGKGPS